MEIEKILSKDAALVNDALADCLKTTDERTALLYEAMRYSAMSGGKRIRPFLVLEFCRLFGGEMRAALPFACAIECVHASSLIHDDMPCMDDDTLRRGKPTNHVVYGEDIALLAGDALITRGYELAARNPYLPPETTLAATAMLLREAGAEGMMGGQQIDLVFAQKGQHALHGVVRRILDGSHLVEQRVQPARGGDGPRASDLLFKSRTIFSMRLAMRHCLAKRRIWTTQEGKRHFSDL